MDSTRLRRFSEISLSVPLSFFLCRLSSLAIVEVCRYSPLIARPPPFRGHCDLRGYASQCRLRPTCSFCASPLSLRLPKISRRSLFKFGIHASSRHISSRRRYDHSSPTEMFHSDRCSFFQLIEQEGRRGSSGGPVLTVRP